MGWHQGPAQLRPRALVPGCLEIDHPQIWLQGSEPLRKLPLGFLVRNLRRYHNLFAWRPVHGRCDTARVSQLQTVDRTQDLNEIASGAGRSEERRVRNKCVSTCKYRWTQLH